MNKNWIKKLENFFENKNILILGLGLEGKAALNFLGKKTDEINYANIYLLDKFKNEEDYIEVIEKELGENISLEDKKIKILDKDEYDNIMNNLDSYDIVLKSPGIHIEDEIIEKYKEKIYSQIEIFLKYFPGLTIGITGTKGKSTTSALMHHIISSCGYKSHLLGNIGNAVFYALNDISEEDIAIIELSSFALEFIESATNISLISNIFVAHLDYHKELKNYVNAKIKIFENMDKEVSNKKYNYYKKYITEKTENFLNSKYTKKDEVEEIKSLDIKIGKSHLIGEHNKLNAKAVKKVLLDLNKNLEFEKLTEEDIDKAIEEFKGLHHRLEVVYVDKNTRYINDSIATVPESTINAIKSVEDLETLIMGGDDNMLPTEVLIKYINNLKNEEKENEKENKNESKYTNFKNIILLPDSGERIKGKLDSNYNIKMANDVKEAANIAFKMHEKGTILLSPAARSYGYYKNFEDRGNQFKEEVLKLYKNK